MFRRPLLAFLLLAFAGRAQGPSAPQTQTTVVFFTLDSAALDGSAQAAITQAAAGVPRIQLNMETPGAVPYESMPAESRRVEIVVG